MHKVVMHVLGLVVKTLAAALTHDVKQSPIADSRPNLASKWLLPKGAEVGMSFVTSCRCWLCFNVLTNTLSFPSTVQQAYLLTVASSVYTSMLHYCCSDCELARGPVTHEHVPDSD